MITYPEIDPVALDLGILQIRWYGVAYFAGIVSAIVLGRVRASASLSPISKTQVTDLILYIALGAILGGRIGYSLFYHFLHYITNPIDIFKIWEGGMSFHGGLLGAAAGCLIFSRQLNVSFFRLADFASPLCAIGFFFGRIANFINQELWGRPTEVAWGMIFPIDPLQLARHPSQLYEAALEGVALFAILWLYSSSPKATGAVTGLFLTCYGAFRIFVELFREPDAVPGFIISDWGTMGQVLSVPLIIVGISLYFLAQKNTFASK